VFDHAGDGTLRADQMILTHDIGEARGPQAIGERPVGGRSGRLKRREKIGG